MTKVLPLLIISMILAYCSQKELLHVTVYKNKRIDLAVVGMVVMLSFFCGLRRTYNDTGMYIVGFNKAATVREIFSTDFDLMGNQLFYLITSIFRHHISPDNVNVYFMAFAFFTNGSFIRFIKKYTSNFPISILVFFSIGMYTDTLAAMKQCAAVAILTYSIDALLDKKYMRFYIIVFIAMMFHTYSIFFFILPLFTNRPWTLKTYILIFCFVLVLMTFESVLTGFLDVADEAGKSITEEEIFDTEGINPLRLAVFAVPTVLSFAFHKYCEKYYDSRSSLLMNMSMLSFMVMGCGLFYGANMFGRCAMYFQFGSILILPWLIQTIFEPKTARFITYLAAAFYLAFFIYLIQPFDGTHYGITLNQFFKSIF